VYFSQSAPALGGGILINPSLCGYSTDSWAKFKPYFEASGGAACGVFLSPHARRTQMVAHPGWLCPHYFCEGIPVLNSLDCRLRAAECQKMADNDSNPRVQAVLRDMARTWTRLASEAEQTLKQSRPPLQLTFPNPLPPLASPQAPRGF
jgi:hypothetical protein